MTSTSTLTKSSKTFTCVGWQVTLRDRIWQVTLRSPEMGFREEKL